MKPSRTVSYYREDQRVAITTKSGKQKFFTPGRASVRRLRKILTSLEGAGRCGFAMASIYGGGIHLFVDPSWLRRRR